MTSLDSRLKWHCWGCFFDRCGFSFDDTMATASYGILGLGNMTISIPKQMADQDLIEHVIGFCFSYGIYQVDYDQRHANLDPVGYLVLGQPWDYDIGYQWIPMGQKPSGCGYVCKIILSIFMISLDSSRQRFGR
jgi:hypothetical protein